MSKFLDLEGLGYYTQCFKPGLAEVIDSGAKNLCLVDIQRILVLNPTATQSGNTITKDNHLFFTINSNDITINSDGQNNLCFLQLCNNNNFTIQDGITYMLSGCQGGSSTTYDLRVSYGTGTYNYPQYSEPIPVVYRDDTTYNIAIVVRANQTLSDITIRPMLCTKSAWNISQTYQPYRPTEDEQNMIIDSKANLENVSYKTATSSFSGTNMQVVFDEDMFSQSSFRGSVLMMFGTQKASVNNSLLLVDFYDSGIKSIRYLTSGTGEVITAIGTIHNNKHGFNFTADANSYTYPCCLSLFANKDIQPKFTVSVVT